MIADREGEYNIGPFEVTYGNEVKTVEGMSFRFGKMANDPDMQIAFSLPRSSVYVGQEIPLTIRWSFAGEPAVVQYAFDNLQISSPLFDQFTLKDQPHKTRTALLTIARPKRGLGVEAEVTQEEQNGRRFVVVTGTLMMLRDTPGTFDSIPITCRTEKATQFRETLLGTVAIDPVPALAVGTPLTFEVKPIPSAGRPASFSGAVGRTFSIDVSANRSVVQVGDPISLTISVRGDGNVEKVSLPDLAGSAALPADLFQIPSEQAAGTFDGNVKQFKVNVRVKDQRVEQIPPIGFSWFDPWEEQFQTAQSRPIALQVMEAQVVSAADVVSASPDEKSGTAAGVAPLPGTAERSGAPAAGMAFVGANVAIERNAARLLENASLGTSPTAIAIGVYALAAAVLLGGLAPPPPRKWTPQASASGSN